jgi:hypothetical protein
MPKFEVVTPIVFLPDLSWSESHKASEILSSEARALGLSARMHFRLRQDDYGASLSPLPNEHVKEAPCPTEESTTGPPSSEER